MTIITGCSKCQVCGIGVVLLDWLVIGISAGTCDDDHVENETIQCHSRFSWTDDTRLGPLTFQIACRSGLRTCRSG